MKQIVDRDSVKIIFRRETTTLCSRVLFPLADNIFFTIVDRLIYLLFAKQY